MHRSEPSRLQSLAQQLTDKVINFVDTNERVFELKQGIFIIKGFENNCYSSCVHFKYFKNIISNISYCIGNFFARSNQGFRDRQNYNRGGQDRSGRQRRDRERNNREEQ